MSIFTFESYRSAIGDFNPPSLNFWDERTGESAGASNFMMVCIWGFYLMNQFITLVFGVNFVVAQVG